ncbi:molybdate ABC transporter substrate-binding protein [Thalassobacillus devorans]|uniref:Molybdate ABC transporter substrate-binding protein n=1 Tax=Thalassobacillus devorans TaxID=279813 RepID=A0ABQ1PDN6_9BACI|nr:molybdate ABC transporter substrate-binding protein [Thalassobacillus devorans]NIK29246.1 molybdate transport system substrate-binding protein [Thalassobacillus devorans]GGC95210.1 molybdate ABC transporter substrate-binding protein [Thalassobacillus devorans]
MIKRIAFFMIPFILIVAGCSNSDTEENQDQTEIKIAAASDLILAFKEAGDLFEEETGTKVTFSFGSTGQLAEQIRNGAPFDVFAAADVKFVDTLKESGLIIPETQTTYAFGRIGISTLTDSSVSVQTLDDLLKPEVKKVAIANPEHAPYGLAAKQALENAGVWEQLEDKLVYGRNISDTLAYVESGNAEAGIIALSLYQEENMDFEMIDDELHAPLEQSVAVLEQTDEEEAAKQFLDFIKGPKGQPIMESYGFIVPEGK